MIHPKKHLILSILDEMPGGLGTTKEIAEKTNIHVHGVAQALGSLWSYVKRLGGRGRNILWRSYGVPYDTKCAICNHEADRHVSGGCLWRRRGAVRACDCSGFIFKSENQRRLIKCLSARDTYD